ETSFTTQSMNTTAALCNVVLRTESIRVGMRVVYSSSYSVGTVNTMIPNSEDKQIIKSLAFENASTECKRIIGPLMAISPLMDECIPNTIYIESHDHDEAWIGEMISRDRMMGIEKPPYGVYCLCGNLTTGQENALALTADCMLSKLDKQDTKERTVEPCQDKNDFTFVFIKIQHA
ncbi:hypothetical protein STEG23_024432, partial [Scotinomys teguina]